MKEYHHILGQTFDTDIISPYACTFCRGGIREYGSFGEYSRRFLFLYRNTTQYTIPEWLSRFVDEDILIEDEHEHQQIKNYESSTRFLVESR